MCDPHYATTLLSIACVRGDAGIVGVLLGIGVGNMVASQLSAPFALPWDWVIVALCLSGTVSLGSGYYPARRAAQLDPIESLRHA